MLALICRSRIPIIAGLFSIFLASCSSFVSKTPTQDDVPASKQASSTQLPDARDSVSDLHKILPELAQYRVVLVGEQHDRLDHHVMQLEVIEYLHSQGAPLAIGLEYFQQPYQAVLDAYIAGAIDEQKMLEQSEYFERWGYDYRHYAPILRFARRHQIPLVALNIPGEIVRKTSRDGLASLSEQESQYLPEEIDRSVDGYEDRIKASFESHEGVTLGMLENFIDAQLLWDEGMAEEAASYLFEKPERLLVILAGAGHIEYRTGIPRRLERRIYTPVATVLPVATDEAVDSVRADYQIDSPELSLPAKGLMGILLDESELGIYAQSFTENSAAEKAGLLAGDFLRSINSATIRQFSDIKLALWDAKPGETIELKVERIVLESSELLDFKLTLH